MHHPLQQPMRESLRKSLHKSLHKEEPQLEEYSRKSLIFAVQLLGNQADAEDVVQASLEKALTNPKAPSGGVDLQKWLYRVVRNASIDRIRQRSRQTDFDEQQGFEEQSATADNHLSPEAQLESEQIKQRLELALKALPLNHRELVVLRDYHGHSYEEIADILAIPQGTVMSRLHRARLALRDALSTNDESNDEVNHESL